MRQSGGSLAAGCRHPRAGACGGDGRLDRRDVAGVALVVVHLRSGPQISRRYYMHPQVNAWVNVLTENV